jgi:hypothetical protein
MGYYGEAISFISLSLPEFVSVIKETTSTTTGHLVHKDVKHCG